MGRSGNATLASAHLLNYGVRWTLKTKVFGGLASIHFLSVPNVTVCRVEASPRHKISFNANYILNDRSHVLYLPTQKRFQAILNGRYDERREGLRMGFITNHMQKTRVVRSWAKRRMDQAMTEALRARGFDRNGRRLKDSNVGIVKGSKLNSSPIGLTTKSAPEALIGTVNVHVLPSSIETRFTEVQRQAAVVADKVLEICGRCSRHG